MGGVVSAALLLLLVLLLVCLAMRKLRGGWKVDLTKTGRQQRSDVELGRVRARMEPQIGSSNYRALYNYQPQNSEDLQLVKGEWVVLVEAPYGGEWWRGRQGEREGWFPKNYVEYVDVEQERKKAEEGKVLWLGMMYSSCSVAIGCHWLLPPLVQKTSKWRQLPSLLPVAPSASGTAPSRPNESITPTPPSVPRPSAKQTLTAHQNSLPSLTTAL